MAGDPRSLDLVPPLRGGFVHRGQAWALLGAGIAALLVVALLGARFLDEPSERDGGPATQATPRPALEHRPGAAGEGDVAAGPVDAPALTQPELVASGPAMRVVGRAVGHDGEPLAGAHLRARLDGDGSAGPLGALVRTGEDARFVWSLPPGPVRDVGAARDVGPARDADARLSTIREGFECVARIRIPAGAASGGELDLGDVRFEAPPMIVAGRVMDPSGAPVADVRLSVSRAGEQAEPESSASRAGMARSDQAGLFAIRGLAPQGPLILIAQHAERPQLTREFQAGEEGVLLVMPHEPGYRGRVLLEPAILYSRLRLVARGSAEAEAVPISLEDRGRFRFEVSWRGRTSLELQGTGWVGEPMRIFDDLHLTPEAAHEERLDVIDLRGRVTITRLKVEDPDGAALRHILLTPLSTPGDPTRSTVHAGSEHLLAHADPAAAVLVSSGFLRAAEAILNGGYQTVVLARGYSVTVTFEGVERLPAGVDVTAWFRPADARENAAFGNVRTGVVRLELPSAGPWRGGIRLQRALRADVASELEGHAVQAEGQEFALEIAATNEPQHFTIPIDALTLERAAGVLED